MTAEFRRPLAETEAGVRRTLFETERTGFETERTGVETDARSCSSTQHETSASRVWAPFNHSRLRQGSKRRYACLMKDAAVANLSFWKKGLGVVPTWVWERT